MFIFRMVINKISKGFFILSAVIIFFLAAIVFYNVILRYIFRMPTFWSTEVTSIMLVMLTFLAIAELAKQRAHIKFTLFLDGISSRKRYFAEILSSFFGLIFCVILTWQGCMATYIVYIKHMCMPSLLATPLFVPYLFFPLGAITLFLQFLVRIIDNIQYLKKGEENNEY